MFFDRFKTGEYKRAENKHRNVRLLEKYEGGLLLELSEEIKRKNPYRWFPKIIFNPSSIKKDIEKDIKNFYRIAGILGYNNLKDYFKDYWYPDKKNLNPGWSIQCRSGKEITDGEKFKVFRFWMRNPINKYAKMVYFGYKDSIEYPKEFNDKLKKLIKLRDNFICQLCEEEILPSLLHIHHIDYNKDNCKTDNLISLCSSCHPKTNFNREQWKYYFKDLLT